MTPSPDGDIPLFEPPEGATYSLEIVAEITGVSSRNILLYQEQGLVHPVADSTDFDDDTIHTLRRIEHLKQVFEPNLSGIRLILGLMDELDRLKTSLRSNR